MQDPKSTLSTREKLILSGVQELSTYGIQDFSTRRVAKACNISCATPYKHFKDTQEFISEILTYINKTYIEQQKIFLEQYKNADYKTQLIKISMHYIKFLLDYPEFANVIMQTAKSNNEKFRSIRGQLTHNTYILVSKYCRENNIDKKTRTKKTFMFRSIVYCATLYFSNNELEYNEENIQMIEDLLERELNLP